MVNELTHWGWMTHICVVKLTIIGSSNGKWPRRRQAIIWTNAVIWLIGVLGTNFSEISMGIQTFYFKKKQLKMSPVKWRPFCLGLNVLMAYKSNDFGTQQSPHLPCFHIYRNTLASTSFIMIFHEYTAAFVDFSGNNVNCEYVYT